MFADLIDSSGLAEKLGAKRFGEILNKYYQDTTEIVFKNSGLIKYQGDGVMAVFGVGESFDFPEERAVDSSLDILDCIKKYPILGDQKIQLGIGINTGQVAAGYVGTEQRTEFNVLGDSVNVVYGLSTIARPDRIMIGHRTANALDEKYTMRSLGKQKIKGRENRISVFEVIG
jgi:adenylate cyclase